MHWLPTWQAQSVRALATFTPLRWLPVRNAAYRGHWALQRVRRHRLEAIGDDRLSRPAQFDIDIRLAAMLGGGGYFVEAGANDGYAQSNTYYLERFLGWRGLLVEPVPHLAAEARRNRQVPVVQAALTDHPGPVRVRCAGLLSVLAASPSSAQAADAFAREEADVREIDVPGRTLSTLLDEAGAPEVTLLSLDLEGFELHALGGLDLDRHALRWLLVETVGGEARDKVAAYLTPHYSYVERFSPLDDLYRRADVGIPLPRG